MLLPGIDGFETCRRLKADVDTRNIPIIFMTSLASAEDKVTGFEVGAVDYVTKPLQQAEVLARLTTHLRLRDVAQNLQEENRQLARSSQVEKARLFEAVNQQRSQLRALTGKLNDAQEGERQRLARELHDEMGQALTALRMNLAAIEKALPAEIAPSISENLTEASLLADQTLEQIRELSLDLRPPMLDDLGLVPTLRWYVKRFAARMSIAAELTVRGDEVRLSSPLETAIYRVLQEALTNVARHAQATMIHLHLYYQDAMIRAEIVDNGIGFDVENSAPSNNRAAGMGLLSMRERVTILDGTFEIASQQGAGTRLTIELPMGAS